MAKQLHFKCLNQNCVKLFMDPGHQRKCFYISIMLKAVAFSNRNAQLKTWKPRNGYILSSAITLI